MIPWIIYVTRLSGDYKRIAWREEALLDVSHQPVFMGEAMGIVGVNGSGKSTFGKALMNMLPYRMASISLRETDSVSARIDGLKTHELSRRGIAMMPQGGAVFRNLTVRDNLRIAFARNTDTSYKEELFSMIPILSDPGKEHLMADRLSGGERQALSLAMTLACKPKLVILDEPSAGLSPADVESTFGLLGMIKEAFGTTIILIEQNINRAVAFCDRVLVMEAGRVVFQARRGESSSREIERIMFNRTVL
jgi:ABC-type branched-subunit amino acid transport system ATPase component